MSIGIKDLIGRLEGAAQISGGWQAKCPCHDDRKASLCLSEGEKGIVLKCMAGCETADIVARLGLTMRDLFYDNGRSVAVIKAEKPAIVKKTADPLQVGGDYYNIKTKLTEKVTRQYDYKTETGTVVLRVWRTDAKSFPVQYRDPDKERWYWGKGPYGGLLYHLPAVRKAIQDGTEIYLVEGEKDADNMAALGYTATTNIGGAGKWTAEMTRWVAGGDIVLIPDNDEPGRKSVEKIRAMIQGTAKRVRVIDLTDETELPKKGDVTDFFTQLGKSAGMDALRRLTDRAAADEAEPAGEYIQYFEHVDGYSIINGGICLTKGRSLRPLCNFVAVPLDEIVLDDGETQTMEWIISGWSDKGKPFRRLHVSADEYERMSWVMKGWGMAANIEPGTGTRDMLRSAIQAAGALNATHRTVYTHTGWRKMPDGRYAYLHAGGAIGAELNVDVTEGALGDYDLCGAVSGPLKGLDEQERIRAAIGYSLWTLNAADTRITVPLLAFMYLAPLRSFLAAAGCAPAFIPFLRGKHQSGKTAIATLMLGHYGRNFSVMHTPASYSDTANNVRKKAFLLKDAPLLVDDYKPLSSFQERRKAEEMAQMLCRAWGDGAERGRMRSDTKLQAAMPPRGLGFETGEDLPEVGESGVGRMYVIDIKRGDVRLDRKLEELQQAAMDGVLTEAMRGYLMWLAAQADTLSETLRQRFLDLRSEAAENDTTGNRRMGGTIAHLTLGLEMMMRFMEDMGVLQAGDRKKQLDTWREALRLNGDRQATAMHDEQPTRVFIETLAEMLHSQKCQVKDISEHMGPGMPMNALGYRDESHYYLFPEQTYTAVQRLFSDQGRVLPLGRTMLYRQLCEDSLAIGQKDGRNLRRVSKCGGQVRGWFLCIPRHLLDGGDAPRTETSEEKDKATQMTIATDDDNPF